MRYNGAALLKQLVKQEQKGYDNAKILLGRGWSITKLTRYVSLLDASMDTLDDLQFMTGFQRLVAEQL